VKARDFTQIAMNCNKKFVYVMELIEKRRNALP